MMTGRYIIPDPVKLLVRLATWLIRRRVKVPGHIQFAGYELTEMQREAKALDDLLAAHSQWRERTLPEIAGILAKTPEATLAAYQLSYDQPQIETEND